MTTSSCIRFVLASLLASVSIAGLGCTADSSEEGDPGLAEPTSEASQALTTTCTLGASCPNPITLLSSVNGQVYRLDMTKFRRLDVFAKVCNPSNWALHLADSPTADGFGGDGSSTDHDAEGYLISNEVQFVSAYDTARGLAGARVSKTNAYPGGCRVVHMAALHAAGAAESTFYFEGDASNTADATQVISPYGFKVGYAACASSTSSQRSIECDWEDAALSDQYYWYVGLNRTVGSSARSGSGVTAACVVFGTDVSVVPTSCL